MILTVAVGGGLYAVVGGERDGHAGVTSYSSSSAVISWLSVS